MLSIAVLTTTQLHARRHTQDSNQFGERERSRSCMGIVFIYFFFISTFGFKLGAIRGTVSVPQQYTDTCVHERTAHSHVK